MIIIKVIDITVVKNITAIALPAAYNTTSTSEEITPCSSEMLVDYAYRFGLFLASKKKHGNHSFKSCYTNTCFDSLYWLFHFSKAFL